MTLRQTKLDEIIILGPRRSGKMPGAVADALANGDRLTAEQEALVRDEVYRAIIGKGSDFKPPPFVEAGLNTGGWMLVRRAVEYTSSDYTDYEATALVMDPEEDPAVQELVEQVTEDDEEQDEEPVEEPVERARPSRRRRSSSS